MPPLSKAASIGMGLALVAAGGFAYLRHADAKRRAAVESSALSESLAAGETVLRVPHAPGAITLDGDTDDPGWTRPPGPARTGPFLMENGNPSRPYAHARLVWGDEFLYMALYASDEDIECRADHPDAKFSPDDDAFHIVFTRGANAYAFDVGPNAVLTDAIRRGDSPWDTAWNSGAHLSREIDGSMNDPKNLDEEWEIELAIPFAALGLRGEPGENVGLSIHRCDTPKGSRRVCSGWGDAVDGRTKGRIVLQ